MQVQFPGYTTLYICGAISTTIIHQLTHSSDSCQFSRAIFFPVCITNHFRFALWFAVERLCAFITDPRFSTSGFFFKIIYKTCFLFFDFFFSCFIRSGACFIKWFLEEQIYEKKIRIWLKNEYFLCDKNIIKYVSWFAFLFCSWIVNWTQTPCMTLEWRL